MYSVLSEIVNCADQALLRAVNFTTLVKTAHLAEAFRMNFETHHGGNSLNNVANLHVIMAIRNTEFFEVLLPDAMQKYGLAEDITVDRDGLVHAPTAPGLGAQHRLRPDRTQEGGGVELKRGGSQGSSPAYRAALLRKTALAAPRRGGTCGTHAPDTVRLRANYTDHFEGGKAGLLVFYIDGIRPI